MEDVTVVDSPTEALNVILASIAIRLKKKWNICVNPDKSVHITSALRKGDCPSIFLNGDQL